MKIVQIYTNGMMEDIDIKGNKKTINKKLVNIAKVRGINELKELYSWRYVKRKIICYGWSEGEEVNGNSHELISDGCSNFIEQDSSEVKLYGDIFICGLEGDKLNDFDISEYGEFYTNNNMYEEYETASSDDEIEEEAKKEDKYISNLKKNSPTKKHSINKLVRDNSEYT